ncbi:MAG: TldD/PmbA family protein [Planctomycetes bacterium]|nr:TldD/PmbA family protein [Planctomycetota bacterium]
MLSRASASAVVSRLLQSSADYAEIYAEESRSRSIRFIDRSVERAMSGIDRGAGVRAVFGTNQVYAYTSDTSDDALMRAADAVALAGSASSDAPHVTLIPVDVDNPHVFLVSPDDVPSGERVDLLAAADASARSFSSQVSQVDAGISETVKDVAIANSDGVWADDHRSYVRLSLTAIAQKGAEKEHAYRGPGAYAGFEFIRSLDIPSIAADAAESAVRSVNAGYAPPGDMPVVVGNGFGGVIFHEACGHALETTSVAKKASVFTDKLGLEVGRSCLTAIDDGTMPGFWGSTAIDDEGSPTQRTVLIENGVLKAFMVDRLGRMKTGHPMSGSGRRSSYRYPPTSRMRNTYIDRGDASLDDLISSVDSGLYALRMGGGSVQPSTGRFNFSVAEGFLIKSGRIAEPVRGATLIGSGPEVLLRIARVGSDLEHSEGICGSVSGAVPTTVGQPTILVDHLTVGGRS